MRHDQVPDKMRSLMSPADYQELYGGYLPPQPPEPPKSDKLEREEQRQFASWCMLHAYAPVWHSTAHRSKASLGCADFVMTIQGYPLAIEFKRVGFKLSPAQEDWRLRHVNNGGIFYVVYSAGEAIQLCEKYAQKERAFAAD